MGVSIALEAIRMVEEGVASPRDIDNAMVLGYKFPIGPLELTENEFWVGHVAGFAVVFEENPPAHAAIDAVAVCATPFWDEA